MPPDRIRLAEAVVVVANILIVENEVISTPNGLGHRLERWRTMEHSQYHSAVSTLSRAV
jgi:hypothetical protein